MKRYNLYIGLNDSITNEQMFSTEKYINVLKNTCKIYHVPFSLYVIQGGYINEGGEFTYETSLQISFIDQSEETVNEIATDLCTFFNQEKVLITQDEARVYFIKAKPTTPSS